MQIDYQDLNDRIVARFWRTNDIDKHLAEGLADIALQEIKTREKDE